MTVNTTTNRTSYAGNGTTTAFAVNFPFLANADLVVLLVTDATGAQTVQTLNTNYTVTGAGGTSGTVTMTVAPVTGTTLVIYRDPALTQLVHPVQNDPLPVDTALEQPLDRLTMITQRGRELDERSLRLPEGDTGFAAADLYLPPKITRASQYLAFDANGKPIASALTSATVAVSTFMATVVDDATNDAAARTLGIPLVFSAIAAMRAGNVPTGAATAFVGGYYAAGDSGGGLFIWDSTSAAADDGGLVINPTANLSTGRWLRKASAPFAPEMFGAKADGATDDSAAITAALAAGDVRFTPQKTYITAAQLLTPANRDIFGYGATLKAAASLDLSKSVLVVSDATFTTGVNNVKIYGLTVDANRASRTTGVRGGGAVYVSASKKITLQDLQVLNGHQDGIEVTGDVTWAGGLADNIRLINCVVDNSYRNNVSVVGTHDCAIIGGRFTNANGAAPQAGIDFEPNNANSLNYGFTLLHAYVAGNAGNGVLVTNSLAGVSGRIIGVEAVSNGAFGVNSDATADVVTIEKVTGSGNTSGLIGGSYGFDRGLMASKVIQTVEARNNTAVTVTATAYTAVNGGGTITTKYSNSKVRGRIRLQYLLSTTGTDADALIHVLRGATELDIVEVRVQVAGNGANALANYGTAELVFDDAVGVAGAYTYAVEAKMITGTQIITTRAETVLEEVVVG